MGVIPNHYRPNKRYTMKYGSYSESFSTKQEIHHEIWNMGVIPIHYRPNEGFSRNTEALPFHSVALFRVYDENRRISPPKESILIV
jgi:hypothetical protein